MNQFIHGSPDSLLTIYNEAQARLNLPAQTIEKDLWVCFTLRELLRLPVWGDHFTFKGGTSLSKAWKLVERFSEDLDLVIDREFLGFGREKLSKKRQRRLKEECSRRIHADILPALAERFRELLPGGSTWMLEAASEIEDRDRQTLLFTYPTVFSTPAAYLRPVVKLEMGARSKTAPFEMASIISYVAEAVPGVIVDGTFQARVVVARLTFWDKALLLHEETYRPKDSDKPIRKVGLARHYYDLYRMIKLGVGDKAIADKELFEQVVEHRQVFFPYTWMDYTTMRRGSLRLLPLDDQISAWRQDYQAMRTEMFFGETPTFDLLLQVVGEFASKFNGS
jgi:hypothetical protein